MSSPELTIPLWGESRKFFEKAHYEHNGALQTAFQIEASFRNTSVRHQLGMIALNDFRDTLIDFKATTSKLSTELEATYQQPGDTSTDADVARTQQLINTLDTNTYLHNFVRHADRDPMRAHRSMLADGLYGECAQDLEDLLDKYDNSLQRDHSEYYRKDLLGVINETTMLSLLNRRQNPDIIVTPAWPTDDLAHRTDLVYWNFTNRAATQTIPLQVKTSRHHTHHRSAPRGGKTIFAAAIRNYSRPNTLTSETVRPLRISRLIAQEQTTTLSETESRELDYLGNTLHQAIRQD